MKTPNPTDPIRNTLKHLAFALSMGGALYFGAAPASAAPPVTTGLTLHLDASTLGLSDNDPVTTWTDVSGLGNNATASGAPIYKTGVLNAQPVVRFDGNSWFTTANLSTQFPTATTGFIVTTINSDSYTLFHANNDVDEWWRFGGQSYPGFFRSSRLNAYCPMPNSGSHLFAITSSASAWEMSINGASQGVAGGAYSAAGALMIGNSPRNRKLTGDIAEIIIYDRVLSGSEANQVGVYLATKYGLSTTYGAPPTVLSFTPPDGGTTATESDLVATFNELIAIGTGDITIKNLTDSTQTVITLPDSQVSVSGSVLTINPTADLLAGKNYAVQIATGAIKDLADLPFAGILNDTTWNFAAAAATATITTVVSSGSPSIYGDSVTFTATVSPTPSGGTVQFSSGFDFVGTPVAVDTITGEASVTTTTLGAVSHGITAEYSGNFQFAASTSASFSQVVNKAPLSVTAQNLLRFQNAANPDPLPQQITGFKNGQTLGTSGVTGTPVLSTTAVLESPVGGYPITCDVTGMSADNYSFTPQNGTLTVLPASAAPPVTTDLKLHLNASQLTGLSDGDAVTHWADMSGMFNNATTSAGTPIYKTNQLNGNPVIRFDDSSALTTADLSSQFPTAATVFIVTTLNTDDGYTLVKANPGVDEYWRFGFGGRSYPAVFRASRLEDYCAMPSTDSHLFAITSSASAWEMAINGASQGVAGGNYNSGGALVIGNGSSGGGLDGDIAEVLIYSRVLTSEETNVVGSYLASKYDLTTSYGSSSFANWATDNAPGQTPNQDHDNDGVENGIEYFMGETGSSFTDMPSLDANNMISWPAEDDFAGTYEVKTSPDLATWTNVDPRPVPVGGILNYTLPPSAPGGKSFVRLLVTPTP
jgi:uncharacterized Zn-binding protein involved in type VI secretion